MNLNVACTLANNPLLSCTFDKTPTLPIISFELFVIIGTIVALFILSKISKQVLLRYFIVTIGVLIFEVFTAPMWNNFKLGWWAYVYKDVTWVLTIGWSTLILSTVTLIDKFFAKLKEWQKFGLYLILLTILVFIAESVVLGLGIRSYSPEVLNTLVGYYIFNVPIEGLYYIPVFISLVISFYKYWGFMLDKEPIIPIKRRAWLRNLAIAFIGVFFFELMIEPMVVNAKLPSWSYVYRDISFLMTGFWILIIWLSTNVVDKYLIHYDLRARFLLYLLVAGAFTLPLESWFIIHGFRVYGPSAVANFTGFNTPITNVPVEVAFAIPCYLALIISFIRCWEINLDNKR
ncbi:MAG: hypothetical protein A2126_02810 [Candidatus Woykebacteria bacterium GWB1_45_5]|uniref:Uncharacterized protein n=2 Tax=Candidatus Woykeibacteriota TaxID=1817899 RepID=A0A1G1VZW7_9BACT|nr:MAG: hypothetical protein A2113_01450 [Candidatus Woykebacteria bacterium GWA1_44_8]OGY24748.1 MAG: hypothetical protein A2126_02810 [Candidatus Woykebacteria bacterium GWB1_45_5]